MPIKVGSSPDCDKRGRRPGRPIEDHTGTTMDRRRAHALDGLRRSRAIGWLAVVLLLFQVVLSTDHLGADAARAFGPTPLDRAVGLLSLCHGDGSLDASLALDDDPDHPVGSPTPCILCSVAAVAAHGVVSHAPEIAALAPVLVIHRLPILSDRPVVRTPLRYGTQRGPPAVLLV